MTIPDCYRFRYVYHFTHIDNLEGILEHGILSFNEQRSSGLEHRSVAIEMIQKRRSIMPVTCGPGGVVHDYVPFYFCKRSSMLLSVLQTKNVDQQFLIYFALPIAVIDQKDTVFTDAAANTDIPPNFYESSSQLSELNWGAIDCMSWRMKTDTLKQARMAEVLFHNSISVDKPTFIVVWNKSIKNYVEKLYLKHGCIAPDIRYDSYHYYTNYPEDTTQSVVTGPHFTKKRFDTCVEELRQFLGKPEDPEFYDLEDLRDRLREDFGCLEITCELIGLETDNPMHPTDVGEHTIQVVETLIGLPEYEQMSDEDKLLAELAAFFHDVGKGPKKRWAANGGKQRVDRDHPLKGLPMVSSVLGQLVEEVSIDDAATILKLVCYHDLIGDIIGRGRNECQLAQICQSEREFNLLRAVSKADIMTLRDEWWNDGLVDDLRERLLENL